MSRFSGERLPGAIGKAFRQYNLLVTMIQELRSEFYYEQLEFDTTEQRFMTALSYNTIDTHLSRKLNPDELLEELVSLCFAGSGTAATLLTYVMLCLARPGNQHIQNRLREEVRASGRSLTQVQHLLLLNAVIQETHYVYPSLVGMLQRTLDNSGVIGRHILSRGTLVAMQDLVHQRNPTLFSDPRSWIPDQWLNGCTPKEREAALTPFAVGPRNCISQNLAKAELCSATSKIVQVVRLSVSSDMTDDDMFMEDRGSTVPKGKRCLLHIELLD